MLHACCKEEYVNNACLSLPKDWVNKAKGFLLKYMHDYSTYNASFFFSTGQPPHWVKDPMKKSGLDSKSVAPK